MADQLPHAQFAVGMFFNVIGLFVVLYMWDKTRKDEIEMTIESFKYKLFALRDKLRWLAIVKKLDVNNPDFDYLDKCITNSIGFLPSFSIYMPWLYRLFFQKKHYGKSFSKGFDAIYSEYREILTQLTAARSPKSTWLLRSATPKVEQIIQEHINLWSRMATEKPKLLRLLFFSTQTPRSAIFNFYIYKLTN